MNTELSNNKILNNSEDNLNSEIQTERSAERIQEDKEFVPVIVKRTDEAIRHPDDVLEKAIDEGLEQIRRPFISLILSSMAAGLILSFTAMAVAVIATFASKFNEPVILRISTALVYPFGFIICIISGTQLFTEHTATAVYPVLEGRAKIIHLFRLWLLVIIGNLAGAVLSAGLLTLADDVIQAEKGYIIIAHHLVSYSNISLIFSSILAGWLMALGGWLILATPPTISQIACIYIVTFLIGLGGLHHSIAGSVEMFTALFISSQFSISQTARFISLAITGNLIGGSIFVAILNYGHIRKTQEIEHDEQPV
ncbi:Formate/nitrite transporter [Desulfonema limicola]|uniref:Formate/nitrite transporter n=1 Tax=Desulfonema limicola TaxID=45656 RepID=A0A975B916_9BACT|nr:formate/nitrite transporter family protein [Desulfonema limicola]QTA80810.1 Formate/nitrite transporter [Desulfonema limicola]